MNSLIVLPILIPLCVAAGSLLVWRWRRMQRWLAVGGAAAQFVSALALLGWVRADGIQAIQVGMWPAPFGITLVADLFAAIMVAVSSLMGLAVVVYSLGSMDRRRESHGYYPIFHVLLVGVCGAFLAGDVFNLFVWFEVMLMASFTLLALGSERAQLEGAIKYVTLNLISSAVFLTAAGILYGVVGTLNMADLHAKLPALPSWLATALAMLFLITFGVKAAIFPLFFWLPASYHTPPVAVSAIFAGLLTKVGVYALIRVFTLLFVHDTGYTHGLILVVSGLTMLTGVLGAMAQNEFRRILSFHIVSQIGYMLMGLGLFGLARSSVVANLALAASIFYIVHHIIVKTNLYLISGVVQRLGECGELKSLGGVYRRYPALGVLFLIPALSLAGIPPLSGFFAKLALIVAALQEEQYLIVATALLVGLLTLVSMTKIWNEVFWKPSPPREAIPEATSPLLRSMPLMLLPIVALAALTVLIGLAAEPLFQLADEAARQLADPTEYIEAVKGIAP